MPRMSSSASPSSTQQSNCKPSPASTESASCGPTTVYMYLVRDTVEEAIYQMSVERRLDHMGRSKDQKQQQKQGDESSPSSAPASRPLPGRGTAAPAPVLYEAALDKANSLEMQEAPLARLLVKSRGGGELVSDADLWSCLFKRAAMAAGAAERTSVQDGDLRSDFERRLRATAAEGAADGGACWRA